jgi:hypothetical protein
LIQNLATAPTSPLQLGCKFFRMHPALKNRIQQSVQPSQVPVQTIHIEKVIRCRKCFRSGSATWEATSTGALALLALSDGFHRRARVPLSLPPEIVCNCGAVQGH